MKNKINKYANVGVNQKKQEKDFMGRKEGIYNQLSQYSIIILSIIWFLSLTKTNEETKLLIRARFEIISNEIWFQLMMVSLVVVFAVFIWCISIVSKNHQHMFRTGVSKDYLMIEGVFKYTRNPFYLVQSIFMVTMLSTFYAAISNLHLKICIIGLIFYLLFLYLTIKEEEKRLEAKYGQKYLDYKKVTPRFWPRDWLRFLKEARFPEQESEPTQ